MLAAAAAFQVAAAAAAPPILFPVVGGQSVEDADDTGAATLMPLFAPGGIGVAVAAGGGSLLVADERRNRVVRVTADGWRTVLAGTGQRGFSGDGGPAASASLDRPRAVAALPDGGFLIADTYNDRVRRVDAAGGIHTVAGSGRATGPLGDGGRATEASVVPGALAVLPDGGFLVADRSRLRYVGPDGIIHTVAGTGTYGSSGDGGPAVRARIALAGISVAADGGVLVAGDRRVRRVAPDGTISTVAGGGRLVGGRRGGHPAVRARLADASDVAALADGGFLIADGVANEVASVNADGIFSTLIGREAFTDFARREAYARNPAFVVAHIPLGVAASPDGILISTDSNVLLAPAAVPAQLSVRIAAARVSRNRTRLTLAATRGAHATVEARRGRRVVARTGGLTVAAGVVGVVALPSKLRPAIYTVRVTVTGGTAIAADQVQLLLGDRLPARIARHALDSEWTDGDEFYWKGVSRCARFGRRRVDCEIADNSGRRGRLRCLHVFTVRLGSDGLLHDRGYRCPRRAAPVFRAQPRYRTGPTLLPFSRFA